MKSYQLKQIFVLILLVGVAWRCCFALTVHPASNFLYSDMHLYAQRAINACRRTPETIVDTIFPPGVHMFFGSLYCLSNGFTLSEYFLLFFSIASLGTIWIFARLHGSSSVARLAVALAALYSPFIDFSGYLMAESLLLPLLLLASSYLSYGLFRERGGDSVSSRSGAAVLISGFIFSLSALVKTQGFATLIFYLPLCFFSPQRWRHRFLLTGLFVVGAIPVLAASAERCTRLSEGHFCLVANNAGYNMLLGHSPGIRTIYFSDKKRDSFFYFASPTTASLNWTAEKVVPYGAYESEALTNLAWQQFEQKPKKVVAMTWFQLQAVFGRVPLWPTSDWASRWYACLGNVVWWLVLAVPIFLCMIARRRELPRLCGSSFFRIAVPPIAALVCCTVLGGGEPRYRIPFDGYFIVAAAKAWMSLLRAACTADGAVRAPLETSA